MLAKAILIPLLTLLLIQTAVAESEKGILDRALDAIRSLFSKITGLFSNKEKCDTPYIRSGEGCCLDENENLVCDNLEFRKTTTTSSSTTIRLTTSSTLLIKPTTTIRISQAKPACYTNADCGNVTEERVCYQGDVYLKKEIPMCQNPGKTSARCVVKVSGMTNAFGALSPLEKCSGYCVDGECHWTL